MTASVKSDMLELEMTIISDGKNTTLKFPTLISFYLARKRITKGSVKKTNVEKQIPFFIFNIYVFSFQQVIQFALFFFSILMCQLI